MSEADRIMAEVERRKQRAKELGLPKMVFDFYYESARFWPARWAACPDYFPHSVADVQEIGRGVSFSLGQDRYTLKWSQSSVWLPDGDVGWSGQLELSANEKRVFQISVDGRSDEGVGVFWTPSDVTAFVEGPWVKSISALAVTAKRAHAEALGLAERLQRENPKKLADLKERFGIESVEPTMDELAEPRTVELESPRWDLFEAEKTSWWKRLLGI